MLDTASEVELEYKSNPDEIGSSLVKNIIGLRADIFQQLQEDTSSEVAIKILARYCVTLQESIEQIEQGLVSGNLEQVWRACHKIAGTSELLGLMDFGENSRALNKDLQASASLACHQEELGSYLEQAKNLRINIEKIFPDYQSYL